MREGIVCRDIGGLYFAIDVHDKYLYRNHRLIALNKTAYEFMNAMCSLGVFDEEQIYNVISEGVMSHWNLDKQQVCKDITFFAESLISLGWVKYE